MGTLLRRLIVPGALLVSLILSGCATTDMWFQETMLKRDLESGDIERIERAYRGKRLYASSSRATDELKGLVQKAHEVLSEEYLNRLMSEGEAKTSLSQFNAYCRNRIQTECTADTRQRMRSAELEILNRYAAIRQRAAEANAEKVRSEIETGERPIQNISDVQLMYEPADGTMLLFSPRISGGDGQYYSFRTYITAPHGEHYLSWWPDAGIYERAGAVILKPKMMFGNIRFGSEVTVVGKYLGNQTIPLANGGQATVPVFGEAYVEGGR